MDGPLPGAGTGFQHPQHADTPDLWRDFLEQLEPFSGQVVFELEKAGGVAVRLRQAVDRAGADRIDRLREYDRNGTGLPQQRRQGRARTGHDRVEVERDQLRRILAQARGIAAAPAVLDAQIAADLPAGFLQSLQECRDIGLRLRLVGCGVHQHADLPHSLLRASGELPRNGRRRRAAEQRDELAPPHHSITSSARRRRDSGIDSPIALAVVRLMTRSNLVGCSTGRSAGFAPRKILSTISAARRHKAGKFGP